MARAPLLRRCRRGLVLALDLSRPVTDRADTGVLSRLVNGGELRLLDVLEAVDQASRDPAIVAMVARVDAPARSWAHAQELHAAVRFFRDRGKATTAHAQSFGEAGDGTLAYLVACAFDEIHLQPSGELAMLGVSQVTPFVAELLERLAVRAEFDHREEFKTATKIFTERGFTDAHRQSAEAVVASLHAQLLDAVATTRNLTTEQVADLVDRAPLLAARAHEAGLVDRLTYRDQSVAAATKAAGPRAQLVTLDRYLRRAARRRRLRPSRATVALVHAQGAIQLGRGRRATPGPVLGSDTMSLALEQARRDRRVRAIVLRIDSPGGSAAASDAIWRAVVRTRESGTPVVVSMGSVAASGGYWIALGADRIVASPGTLTGSIGVVYGKFSLDRLGARLGINPEVVQRGDNALLLSSTQPFTPEQHVKLAETLDDIYVRFTERVRTARGLDAVQVDRAARGRVWTAADAVAFGLVDDLGGYQRAFSLVRELIGLPQTAQLRVQVLPHTSLLERLGLRPPPGEQARSVRGELEGLRRDTGIHPAGAAVRLSRSPGR